MSDIKKEFVIIDILDENYPYFTGYYNTYSKKLNDAFCDSYDICLKICQNSYRFSNRNRKYKIINKLSLVRKLKLLEISKK